MSAKQQAHRQNGGFRDQLKTLSPEIKKKARGSVRKANANEWAKDGVDHINFSRYGETTLGRALNLDFVRHWNHDVLGSFKSVNSMWFFLLAKVKDDSIRQLTEMRLKAFVKEKCGQLKHVPNFRAIMLDGIWQFVNQFPKLKDDLKASTLPFDWYRVNNKSGIRERFRDTEWLADGYEEIRAALKEGREPDFSFAINNKGRDPLEILYSLMFPSVSKEGIAEMVAEFRENRDEEKKKRENIERIKATPDALTFKTPDDFLPVGMGGLGGAEEAAQDQHDEEVCTGSGEGTAPSAPEAGDDVLEDEAPAA